MRIITNVVNHSKTMLLTSSIGTMLGLSLVLAPVASALSIGGPSDCDSNAIISCGAHSTGALMQAYNSSAYVQKVYAYFGISSSDMANLQVTNVAGRVTSDGKVFVDSQSNPVANGAITGGRQNIAGSTQVNFQGVTFFKRPPSVSFQQASLPAFVSMKNGQFQFAIIASCGNAVRANATQQPTRVGLGQAQAVSKPQAKPAPPKPTPTATQTQTQSQSQQVNIHNSNTNVQNVQTTPATSETQPATTQQPAATTTASQPASLVNTGPTGLVAVFLASSIAGSFGFRRFILHKFNS